MSNTNQVLLSPDQLRVMIENEPLERRIGPPDDCAGTTVGTVMPEDFWIERIYRYEFCNLLEVYSYEVYPFQLLYVEDFAHWCLNELHYSVSSILEIVVPAIIRLNERKIEELTDIGDAPGIACPNPDVLRARFVKILNKVASEEIRE